MLRAARFPGRPLNLSSLCKGIRQIFKGNSGVFLAGLKTDTDPRLQIWVAYGDADRLLPGIERLIGLLPPERVFRLKGGHTWEVWTKGFTEILAKIDVESDLV